MKIEKSKSQILFEFKNGIMINIWQNITEIFTWKNYNWNTYQFINIEFEKDTYLGAYEFIFVFMCCGIRIRIPVPNEKSKKEWKKMGSMLAKIKKSCYGWVNGNDYRKFRTKKQSYLYIYDKKLKSAGKKIFLQ